MKKYRIVRLEEVTEASSSEINSLLFQLSPESLPRSLKELDAICGSHCQHLYVLIPAGSSEVVGMLTLLEADLLSGRVGRIEDVVVEAKYRGEGLGEVLLKHALKEAGKRGIRRLYLSSRPSREAANALYRKLGFQQKETNVYSIETGE